MTQEEFIAILNRENYSYEIEGDKIIVNRKGDVDLESLTSLSPGVEFRNDGNVWLESLTSIPSGVEFKNRSDVRFPSLETLPPSVKFKNGGYVHLVSLKTIPPGVEFKNGGDVKLSSIGIGYFNDWKGNIEGIASKRLLNVMIKQGIFER
jgi:hypothetical protein